MVGGRSAWAYSGLPLHNSIVIYYYNILYYTSGKQMSQKQLPGRYVTWWLTRESNMISKGVNQTSHVVLV